MHPSSDTPKLSPIFLFKAVHPAAKRVRQKESGKKSDEKSDKASEKVTEK